MKIAPVVSGAFGAWMIASAVLADPLPSWNDTESKTRIVEFVEAVTDPASEQFVPVADRIATFDNDGTLWGEKPAYFQLFFAIYAVGEMAKENPDLLTSDTLKAAADGDVQAVLEGGEEALIEVVEASHSGLSVEEYQANVEAWLDSARHPETGMAYDDMVYQPMLELLSYLRDEGFKTYIVSGGGLHFMRTFAEDVYGIVPEQVLGTYTETTYELVEGVPTIVKAPAIAFIDDKEGKPINIERTIGRRPIFVGGNSDGDFAMLEWSTAGEGPRLGLIVHHTDGAREYAYDRDSHVGRLDRGLDEAETRGWLLVDMAEDWQRIWP